MKTILYNPIFINPQAYYVFPRLTRYLQPDNESTSEPANYIGTIEVKVIAYGDTTLKRTYTNTDSIDLSEFKNTWIRISLFTKVGSCVLGEWKIGNMESDLPYIDPEVLASLKAVVIVGNKTNNDSDRAIVKNLVDPDNPFVISNAAYEGMSGYNGYPVVFGANKTWEQMPTGTFIWNIDDNKLHITKALIAGNGLLFSYVKLNDSLLNVKEIPSFKIKVSGLEGKSKLWYRYLKTEDAISETTAVLENGTHELPKSYIPSDSLHNNVWIGFTVSPISEGVKEFDCDITIEVLPEYEGAFVTDGVDDLITSTKTVQEMGITDEITVVSMIGQLSTPNVNNYTNTIRNQLGTTGSYNKIAVSAIDKTGIYGYSFDSSLKCSIINDILGDKQDYSVSAATQVENIGAKYLVQGWIDINGLARELSSVAWYWTVIANKVLTTDQINQVIAYFNLDRTLNPDILCDVKKQGITNENHAEFGDKLIDFSGNGRDIQLNNIAWDGDSGIGKYNYPNWKVNVTQGNKYARIVYYDSINGTYSADFKGITDLYKSYGLSVEIRVNRANTIDFHSIKEDGIYTITPPDDTTSIDIRFGGENVYNASCDITITQIPSHAGALCLDGVNDFGKVTGMPIYKDYTVIADYIRTFAKENVQDAPILSKSKEGGDGAFIFNYVDYSTSKTLAYSFANINNVSYINDFERNIYYQSKYTNNGNSINAGTGVDTNSMWLGTYRDNVQNYFTGAIYSLMSFPYSMSKFLIERQLKKHKLGTLYPNMVEFRPVINSNVLLDSKPTFVIRGTSTYLNAGDYVPENSQIWVSIKMNNIADRITKFTVNGKTIDIPKNAYSEVTLQYGFPFVIDKSPQKIGIIIEQDENYVKFEPVITSNVEYVRLDFYLNNYQKRINIGDYIPKDAYLRANFYLKNNVDELTVFTFNGVNIGYRRSSVDDTAFNINQIYNYDSPQEVNITIDEYIRYEDIVQPYPLFFEFTDENGNLISWGGKAKVGSTITRTKGVNYANLLEGLFTITNPRLNGVPLASSQHVVEKSMVFTCTATWAFDNNEPKVILSPRLLRIPNSSYKILGYIPDISGHGNNGKINNSAYAEGSGVNEDGSYQFDGVDDFVTIPTLSSGGKQVLMKVNWQSIAGTAILYDQRTNGGFAIFNRDFDTNENKVSAYRARNTGGSTYIDGILNKYIYASQLKDITHNIVELYDPESNIGTLNPKIGSSYLNSNYAQMALYDFMLFDNISTDDKIKQLNEYVGIEGNTDDLFNETN